MSEAAGARETQELYIEMDESDIYFLETIIKGYDGIAHVRRDWHMCGGRRFVKILVPPEFMGELLEVLERIAQYMPIGEIRPSLAVAE